MIWPEGGKTVIRRTAGNVPTMTDVTRLGAGEVEFEQISRGLAVSIPDQKPCEYAQCLRVTLA